MHKILLLSIFTLNITPSQAKSKPVGYLQKSTDKQSKKLKKQIPSA